MASSASVLIKPINELILFNISKPFVYIHVWYRLLPFSFRCIDIFLCTISEIMLNTYGVIDVYMLKTSVTFHGNPSCICLDMSLYTVYQPHCGVRSLGITTRKSLGCFLWGPWIFDNESNSCWVNSVWTRVVDWLTLPSLEPHHLHV